MAVATYFSVRAVMTTQYWFGFKQTLPYPAGDAVEYGPYGTREEAMRKREAAKAWDCSVSIPFAADSVEEAREKAKLLT